jgi:hypothetical protein
VGDVVLYVSPATTGRAPAWREVTEVKRTGHLLDLVMGGEGATRRIATLRPIEPVQVQVMVES